MLKKSLKYHRGDHGFTLIEMVIIVVLMGIMAVPIGRLAVLNLTATSQSYLMSEALNYAEGSVQEIITVGRGAGWSTITSSRPFSFPIPARLTRTLSVVTDSLEGVVYKQATVTVSGGGKSVSFSTLLVQ